MKDGMRTCSMALLTTALLLAKVPAQTASKSWVGEAIVHGQQVPVRLELAAPAQGGEITGSFVNGDELSPSSSGELHGTHLLLNFNYYARKLEGELEAQELTGTWNGARMAAPVPLVLHPVANVSVASKSVAGQSGPDGLNINGDWEMEVKSSKGESAWTLRVTPVERGQEIKAVILRIDGDTGGLYGSFDAARGEYRVSHFAASGAALYSLKPQGDALLVTNLLGDGQQWMARRPEEARRENLAPPTKAMDQTSVLDPSKPLQFTGRDLSGKTVTYNDPRFRGKVVIVAIGGSWCPNCHDEAPFLVELYNRYHARGLEVVDLFFEEDDQLKDPVRMRAFAARYRIPYPVLLAGTPDELNEKMPQGKNLNCWPTAFFAGRDGLVKETHAGFSGPSTGAAYTQLKAETSALIERLLNEKEQAAR